jgi:hypothetical protein
MITFLAFLAVTNAGVISSLRFFLTENHSNTELIAHWVEIYKLVS